MNNFPARIFSALLVGCFFSVAVSAAPPPGSNSANTVEGVWRITVQPESGSAYVNIATVSADGTVINSDPFVGVGVGKAYRVEGVRYALSFFSLTTNFPVSPGVPVEVAVRAVATLDTPNTLIGEYVATVTPSGGVQPAIEIDGTIYGERISVEPPPELFH